MLDVKLVKNNDIKLKFNVKNDAGNAVNITNYTVKWQVKKSPTSVALISKSTTDGGIVIEDGVNGVFSVIINATDTLPINAGTYYHEAVMTNTDGKSVTLTDSSYTIGNFILREQLAQQ